MALALFSVQAGIVRDLPNMLIEYPDVPDLQATWPGRWHSIAFTFDAFPT